MNFADLTLTRLADPDLRASIFGQDALQQILAAGYEVEPAALEGPLTAVFDRLSLALTVRRRLSIDGRWGTLSDPHSHQAALTLDTTDNSAPLRVDALWQGAIVARLGAAESRIEAVASSWPDIAGIDAAIVAELGALPESAQEREAQRRLHVLRRWRAAALQPEVVNDAALETWLALAGAPSVSQLLQLPAGAAPVAAGSMQLAFSPARTGPPAPTTLPVSVAVLVRDHPFELGALLAESRLVRESLETQGANRPSDLPLPVRSRLIVAWIVPADVFDDPDWPGGTTGSSADDNPRRRTAARQWLGREGIGLLTLPPHPA